MITILFKHFKGVVLLLLFFSASVFSQNKPVITDSIEVAFLPALSYSSDLGFVLGGLVHKYHYKKDKNPFYSFTQVAALISTTGMLSGLIEHDKPYAFNTNNRFINRFYVSRFLQDSYYGIGAYQTINDSFNSNNTLYSFQSFSVGLNSRLRMPIQQRKNQSFSILAIFNVDYSTPIDNGADRLIIQERPLGINGGRTIQLGTGFIHESRDNEFRPTKGHYIESSIEIGQTWFGSSYNTVIFEADFRKYLSFFLLKEVTWANRFYTKNTNGEVPYWKLAYAGDEKSLRGYPFNRFLDENVFLFNTELRTWLFSIDAVKGEFGGTLFFDVGRTYPDGESFNNIFDDIKYSYGLGGTSSFFTPDFVLRADLGFSEEGIGIYFTAGYMF